MPGASWTQPNFELQDGTSYKTSIDNCIQIAERMCRNRSPREMDTPAMRVWTDSGIFYNAASGTLLAIAATKSALFIRPVTNNRIDRLIMTSMGSTSIVKGACAANPSPPAITAGKYPICQVYMSTTITKIQNINITDERVNSALGLNPAATSIKFTSATGTWICPSNVTTIYITGCGGGGGGAGYNVTGGGGGGAGRYAIRHKLTVTPDASYSYSVGAGGSGGGVNSSGNPGNITTFGTSLFTLTNGVGGVLNSTPATGGSTPLGFGGIGGAPGTVGKGSGAGGGGGTAPGTGGGNGSPGLLWLEW